MNDSLCPHLGWAVPSTPLPLKSGTSEPFQPACPEGTTPPATVLAHKAIVYFFTDIHCQGLEVREFHTVTKFLTSLEKIWPHCQKAPSGAMLPSPARCMVFRLHSLFHLSFFLSFF